MANEFVLHLSQENFEAEVLSSEIPVLVDFWAPWCGPCRMLGPVIDELAEEYDGSVKVCKVNVDDEGALAMEFGVMSIPTVLVFSGGKEVERVTGALPKDHFKQMLSKVL